jgi:predicted TIM-barrel fold metal-dependent hydrolase
MAGLLIDDPHYTKRWPKRVAKMLACHANLRTCESTHGASWVAKMWAHYKPRLAALLREPPRGMEAEAKKIATTYGITL